MAFFSLLLLFRCHRLFFVCVRFSLPGAARDNGNASNNVNCVFRSLVRAVSLLLFCLFFSLVHFVSFFFFFDHFNCMTNVLDFYAPAAGFSYFFFIQFYERKRHIARRSQVCTDDEKRKTRWLMRVDCCGEYARAIVCLHHPLVVKTKNGHSHRNTTHTRIQCIWLISFVSPLFSTLLGDLRPYFIAVIIWTWVEVLQRARSVGMCVRSSAQVAWKMGPYEHSRTCAACRYARARVDWLLSTPKTRL